MGPWAPVERAPLLKKLESWSKSTGWHIEFEIVLHVSRNERYLRRPEPRFESKLYPRRFTYGLFADCPRAAGSWYQVEYGVPSMSKRGIHLGYSVECMVHVFDKEDAQPV